MNININMVEVEVTATLLKNITGLSLSQTTYYLAAMNAPDDVQIEIQNGNIRNLDKAALIAGIDFIMKFSTSSD